MWGKKHICKILKHNGWNKQIFQILQEECYVKFHFSENILSGLTNIFEISHKWVLTNFRYQGKSFYV